MKKKIFACISVLIFSILISCEEESTVRHVGMKTETVEESTTTKQKTEKTNSRQKDETPVKLQITNHTENEVVTVVFYRPNKNADFRTVSIKRGESDYFEIQKNEKYRIDVIDSKHHRYSKGKSFYIEGTDEEEYFFFETPSAQIEFYDTDFKPQGLLDFLFKFFWL